MKKILLILAAAVFHLNAPAWAQKTELLLLPTIHGAHKKNVRYSFDHVNRIITNFKPDVIAVEIRPEDMDQDTSYLKKFYQPEMIMAKNGFPGIKKAGVDFLGSEVKGKHLDDDFSVDTVGEMGRFRMMNQRLMKDSAIVKARRAKGMVRLKAKQNELMASLSANEMLSGYDTVTQEYSQAQTAVLTNTPYQYYDWFSIMRDQKIADNVSEIVRNNPGKRIIVLSGANHHNRLAAAFRKVKAVHLMTQVQDN